MIVSFMRKIFILPSGNCVKQNVKKEKKIYIRKQKRISGNTSFSLCRQEMDPRQICSKQKTYRLGKRCCNGS